MKTSSAKAKGRVCCSQVREALLAAFPILSPEDITVTPSGVTGEDLWVSPRARELIPCVWECKNQESLQLYPALEQAKSHLKNRTHLIPVLAFRRNRSELYAAVPFRDFVNLLERSNHENKNCCQENQCKSKEENRKEEITPCAETSEGAASTGQTPLGVT